MTDADSVTDALVRALPSAAPVTAIERILQGWGNESFVAQTAIGPVVTKVGLPWSDVTKWRASARASDIARGAGVPAPELLAFVDAAPEVGGRVLRVFRSVEGVRPRIEAAPLTFFRELGDAIRRLHSIEVPGFTSRLGTDGFARWSDFLADRWPGVLGRAAQAEIDAELVRRAHALATSLAAAVDDVVSPALCHRDLYLDNVLVDHDGKLVALLDFDIAEVWDPLVEQLKLEWFVFEPSPAARAPFFDGYLAGDPMPAMFDERVRLASIIELLNHAGNWRIQGQPEIAAEALERLSGLLEDRDV